MKTRKGGAVSRQLGALFNLGVIRELTDGQLLERFANGPRETAELAFAALVERHAAMVLRVCRAVLADPHETHDAFQATFLILVKKARGLWVRDSLGPWLYRVALRTSTCARSSASRRRRHERAKAERTPDVVGTRERPADAVERERMLLEEIGRLPERYRVPIVLCDLEGHTCEEAARRMGRPVGTVKCWRARGRERLRGRLTRLGIAPAGGLALGLSADAARGASPAASAAETARLAARVFSAGKAAGEVPASVQVLVNGVLKTMLIGELRTTTLRIIALAALTAGFGAVARVGAGDDTKTGEDDPRRTSSPREFLAKGAPASPETPRENWPLTLRESIRIGLRNSEVIRVLRQAGGEPADGEVVIAPLTRTGAPWTFKSEIMAELRSIEQQYWSLAQQYVQLSASEKAVELGEAILKREQSAPENGRDREVNLAEANQRLAQFRLDLVTKTSDVIAVERGLRRLVGLPPSDGRRIVPVTLPTESLVAPNWEACLATMLEKQPDLACQKAEVEAGEAEVARIRQEIGLPAHVVSPVLRAAEADLTRRRGYLDQVTKQTGHTLARFFLEIDANYKQFKTASRYRAAALQRLEAQQAYYEKGRITIDRYLDAVSQYTSALTQESQFKMSYNISIVALEEAKGTLLEYDKVTVAEGPKGSSTVAGALVPGARPAFVEPPKLVTRVRSIPDPALSLVQAVGPVPDQGVDVAGKTYSFDVSLGSGPNPFKIRGSFTVTPAGPGETPEGQ